MNLVAIGPTLWPCAETDHLGGKVYVKNYVTG